MTHFCCITAALQNRFSRYSFRADYLIQMKNTHSKGKVNFSSFSIWVRWGVKSTVVLNLILVCPLSGVPSIKWTKENAIVSVICFDDLGWVHWEYMDFAKEWWDAGWCLYVQCAPWLYIAYNWSKKFPFMYSQKDEKFKAKKKKEKE